MQIHGVITGITYKTLFHEVLTVINKQELNVNTMPTTCIVSNGNIYYGVSKWVSPKRSRSYPFERVYNSLHVSKKITIIPIIKDEGKSGDRDFIQWDTVSLMSLVDVFVILAYYDTAEAKGEKISNQQFNNDYILRKIDEIEQYHSSALHWNLKEVNNALPSLVDIVKHCYTTIQKNTGVTLHDITGIDTFQSNISNDVNLFMSFSREKARKAQEREYITTQPKENLTSSSKSKLTITNYLGGKYFLTVDEISLQTDRLFLIESKHSSTAFMPSKSDIRDGLLKMILYSNIKTIEIDNTISYTCKAVLRLTSCKLQGRLSSEDTEIDIQNFFTENNCNERQRTNILTLIKEAKVNNFMIIIEHSS